MNCNKTRFNTDMQGTMHFSSYGNSRSFTKQERYDWSRSFVTVNFFKIIDKHELAKIAKIEHDDGRVYTIPFESYIIKQTILGEKLLIQRVWLFNNLRRENEYRNTRSPV